MAHQEEIDDKIKEEINARMEAPGPRLSERYRRI